MKKTKEIKAYIKSKSKIKKAGKIAASILGASIFLAGTGIAYENINLTSLPSQNQIVQTLDDLDANARYMSLKADLNSTNMINNTSISRFVINKNKKIDIILSNDFSNEEVNEIKIATNYLNQVFEIINPIYKFELKQNKDKNVFNENTINVNRKDLSNLNALGVAYIVSTKSFNNFGYKVTLKTINLDDDNINVFNCANVFMHEIMHIFGFGDAYKLENIETTTAMKNGECLPRNFLSKNDFKLLLALYSNNPKLNNQKYQKLIEFRNNFGNQNKQIYYDYLKRAITDFLKNKNCSFNENANLNLITTNSCFKINDNQVLYLNSDENLLYNFESREINQKNSFRQTYFKFCESKNIDDLIDFMKKEENEIKKIIIEFDGNYILSNTYFLSLNYVADEFTKLLEPISEKECKTMVKNLKNKAKLSTPSNALSSLLPHC